MSVPSCPVSVSFVGFVSTSAPSPCERLSRSLSTMSWSDSQLLFGSPSFGRFHLPPLAGTNWVSQVLWCFSSHMPRSCPTPADPPQPHPSGCFVSASGTLKPSPPALLLLTRLYQASESAVSLTAYVIPCVRFNRFVRSLTAPPHGCNTRYEWLVSPYSTGTLTQSENTQLSLAH